MHILSRFRAAQHLVSRRAVHGDAAVSKLLHAHALRGRRARHTLDAARNPRVVSRHAIDRWAGDCVDLGLEDRALWVSPDLYQRGENAVREFCRRATDIYRGRNCYVLKAAPWWIFYRDGTVVTVLHDKSQRKYA